MLYDVTGATYEMLDLNGDGIPDARKPVAQMITVEAESGDQAADMAIARGFQVVTGVNVSAAIVVPPGAYELPGGQTPNEVAETVKRGPGRPRKDA